MRRDDFDHLDHRRLAPMCPGGKKSAGPALMPLPNRNRPAADAVLNPPDIPTSPALLSFLCQK
jgi:hypothetical protein